MTHAGTAAGDRAGVGAGADADSSHLPLLTAEQTRRADQAAIAAGVDGITLMENAGYAAWRIIRRAEAAAARTLAVVTGKGNNGGDGWVVARLAHREGWRVRVAALHPAGGLQGDAAVAAERALAAGVCAVTVADGDVAPLLPEEGIVVDALLGTGLAGPPRPPFAAAIAQLNAWRQGAAPAARLLAALDVPSGLDSDAGRVYADAVRADLTVTFGALKAGTVMSAALPHVGRLWLVAIGWPRRVVPEAQMWLLTPAGVAALLPQPAADAHKGTRGRLWIVAGSLGMSGAAVLAARSALRAGAGLVTLGVPAAVQPVVAAAVPEALTRGLPATAGGQWAPAAASAVLAALQETEQAADAVVLGPGLGTSDGARALTRACLLQLAQPLVCDADGLNLLAQGAGGLRALQHAAGPRVLTPHPGEAARLLGSSTRDVQADRLAAARKLAADSGAVVVLKGARTVIAAPDGRCWINPTGNAALATGGTGDVLAGAIGALLAQGLDPLHAVQAAVFLHGLAGQRCAAERGLTGVSAADLPEAMAAVRAELPGLDRRRQAALLASCGLFGW